MNELTNKELIDLKLIVKNLMQDKQYSMIFSYDEDQKPKFPNESLIKDPRNWDCSHWAWFFSIFPEMNPNKAESILDKTKSFISTMIG